MNHNYVIIMAGGIGSRFWPMSRSHHPKQFMDILGVGKTLLQQTFERFSQICPPENIYIVTNSIYADMVLEQLPDITPEQVISEPARRNTAPCVAYASFRILQKDPKANTVVAPSDHLILHTDVFVDLIKKGLEVTEKNNLLVTLGIKPTRPDTGYGYIQFNSVTLETDAEVKKVKTFTEKPDKEMAKFFIKSGDFVWNSGIFIWNVKSILEAFKNYLPEVYYLFEEGMDVYGSDKEATFVRKAYSQCKNISIDYGVMEKANNVYVLKAEDIGWSDLGTWGSLYEFSDKNEVGNKVIGKNVLLYDAQNCLVNVPKEKLVVLQGLKDYIVVESDGILLICKMADEQKIRDIVQDVKLNVGDEFV